MKITKHKITEWYHVALHCDKCDSIMNPSEFDVKELKHKNTCPICGNIMFTGSMQYPHTQYTWLTEAESEEEVNICC